MSAEAGGREAMFGDDRDRSRQLFRYLAGEEWREYRAILRVFFGTSFAEFTPHEVAAEVAADGIAQDVVEDPLESLRRWGNLAVSSSVGNPSSLEDYYRRRNRYLITRAGQEVFDLVEGVLERSDEIGDVQAGRLRQLHRALTELAELAEAGFDHASGDDLAAAVRSIFDLHEPFASELTRFFAQLNQWQSRYDLEEDEIQFFASVLVDYVSEQLTEIERMIRPVARALERLRPHIGDLLPALRSGLATRLEEAGLKEHVAVRRAPGTELAHWEHLAVWYVASDGRAARLDHLARQALAAVRTLTANVSRLSRLGLGAVSRRADFVRLAGFFNRAATDDETHRIAAAAFGLGSCRHVGTLSSDADDPVATITPWQDAPRAVVPMALRERGETNQRGSATPIRDRGKERRYLEQRRLRERVSRDVAATELLACAGAGGSIHGARLSAAAFGLLRDLIGRSGHRRRPGAQVRASTEAGIRCEVRRVADAQTAVACPAGRLVLWDLVVTVTADDGLAAIGTIIGNRGQLHGTQELFDADKRPGEKCGLAYWCCLSPRSTTRFPVYS